MPLPLYSNVSHLSIDKNTHTRKLQNLANACNQFVMIHLCKKIKHFQYKLESNKQVVNNESGKILPRQEIHRRRVVSGQTVKVNVAFYAISFR